MIVFITFCRNLAHKCIIFATYLLKKLHLSKKNCTFARNCVQGKTQSLNNTNMADILQTIERYPSLGRR